MVDERMPVLVGCGDVTDLHTPASSQRSPYGLIAQAARLALDDTGAAGIGAAIDTVAMIRSFADTSPRFATKLGTSANPPRSQRCGLTWPAATRNAACPGRPATRRGRRRVLMPP